jgi:hypothetical protein
MMYQTWFWRYHERAAGTVVRRTWGFALVRYLSDASYVRMHRIVLFGMSSARRANSALRTLRG